MVRPAADEPAGLRPKEITMMITSSDHRQNTPDAELARRAVAHSRAAQAIGDGELAGIYAELARVHLDRHLGRMPTMVTRRRRLP